MTALVIFTAVSLLMLGSLALTVKNNAESAISMENANNIQSQWTHKVISSVLEGTEPSVELNATDCEFAKWNASFGEAAIEDGSVQAAFDLVMSIHAELHAIAGEAIAADAENRMLVIDTLIYKQKELSENMSIVSAYYAAQEKKIYSAFVMVINFSLIVNILLAILTPRYIRKTSKKLSDTIANPINAVAKWATDLAMGSDDLNFEDAQTSLGEINQMIEAFQVMA